MASQIANVQERLGSLIASFDPNDDTFKITGHTSDGSPQQDQEQNTETPNSSSSIGSHSSKHITYKISDEVSQKTIDWYHSCVEKAAVSEEKRNTLFELATKGLMYRYSVCINLPIKFIKITNNQ